MGTAPLPGESLLTGGDVIHDFGAGAGARGGR